MLAEELHLREVEAKEKLLRQQAKLAEADCKVARQLEHQCMKEENDEKESFRRADFELARRTQEALNATCYIEQAEAVARDNEIAKKLSVKIAREDHRRDKKLQLLRQDKNFMDLKVLASVWAEADAEVEDVAGGICISLVLPFIQNVSCKVIGRRRNKIELQARRTIFEEEDEAQKRSVDGSVYSAEFVIDGAENMLDKDISYEYSSESGILHVYIDNLMLNRMDSKEVSGMLSKLRTSFSRFFSLGRQER